MRMSGYLLAALITAAPAAEAGPRVLRDVAYGTDPAQRIDVYLPEPRPSKAPIVAMVHGGAWLVGDKAHRPVFKNKSERWVGQGMVFVSINNRLVPAADPVQQAEDVARALAFIQKEAGAWGADPSKVILMGHSAGAHLVMLLTADPARAKRLGAQPWLGTVSLDSGALDVPQIMGRRHPHLYDKAFGADPRFWEASSPWHALTSAAPPSLVVCSTQRVDACPQGRAFAAAAGKRGVKSEVLPVNLSHRQVNETLGLDSDYTRRVEQFMKSLLQ